MCTKIRKLSVESYFCATFVRGHSSTYRLEICRNSEKTFRFVSQFHLEKSGASILVLHKKLQKEFEIVHND